MKLKVSPKKMRFILMQALVLVTAVHVFAEDIEVSVPVFKPTFMTGYESFSGGTSFVAKNPHGDELLLVTALHLFGPACGLREQLNSSEVCEAFHAVTGIGMDDYSKFVTSTSPVFLKSANVSDDDGCAGDLAL